MMISLDPATGESSPEILKCVVHKHEKCAARLEKRTGTEPQDLWFHSISERVMFKGEVGKFRDNLFPQPDNWGSSQQSKTHLRMASAWS